MRERSTGVVASIVGRYYAMDRDKRWERVKVAYDLLVEGKGEHSSDMTLAMQKSYDEGVTDEFVKPVVRIDEDGNPIGMIRPNDVVIFFNYRNDRAKELTIVLTQEDMPQQGMHTLPLYYCCMTPYDAKFEGCISCSTRRTWPTRSASMSPGRGFRSSVSPKRRNTLM